VPSPRKCWPWELRVIGSRETEVSSVEHAVRALGLGALTALSMTIAMRGFSLFPQRGSSRQLFWKFQSGDRGRYARVAGFVGIQQDAGYTRLDHGDRRYPFFGRSRVRSYVAVISDYGLDLMSLRKGFVHIDPCEAGRYLLRPWTFPGELSDVPDGHHEPAVAADALGSRR